MSDEEYTNLDLDTAEQLVIAAGRPELAKALRFQTQGIRNLVQGEWGQSFVGALENIMDTRVVNVLTSVQQQLDEQIGLVQQLLTTAREAKDISQQALAVAKEARQDTKKLQGQMEDSQEDRKQLHDEVAAVKGDVDLLRAAIEALKQAQGDGT